MLNRLSIKLRLVFVIAVLATLMAGVGGYGLLGISEVNTTLRNVYDNSLLSAGYLGQVSRSLLRVIVDIGMADSPETTREALAGVERDLQLEQRHWAAYEATVLSPEELVLASTYKRERERFFTRGVHPALAAMRAGDLLRTNALAHEQVLPLYQEGVRKVLNTLIQTQIDLAKAQYDASQSAYVRKRNISILLIAFGLMVGGGMCWWLVRAISLPLNHAVRLAQSVADGDLTTMVEIHAQDETGRLLQALKNMSASLSGMVAEVRGGTETMATASAQIAAGNLDLSSRTERQAAALEEAAASMAQLTAAVKQNADHAHQANLLAQGASAVALKGGLAVEHVVTTMASIKDSSGKIADIVGVIDSIAFQTNLLALNAAVEAARAGEQGRGFAVVASEVRGLAQRSAAAAREIKSLIGDSVRRVETGGTLAQQAGATMADIVASVASVTEIMAGISRASNEQRADIEQINQVVSQMDQVTQQNAALVEQAAAAAQSLQEQARQLANAVSNFKVSPATAVRPALATGGRR